MFKTIPASLLNPQRPHTTAFTIRKRNKINLEENQSSLIVCKQEDEIRPMTTQLKSLGYQTLNTTRKNSPFVHLRSISAVENQLQDQFKQQMCGYLKRKLKNMVEKKQSNVIFEQENNKYTQQNEFYNTSKNICTSPPLRQFYTIVSQEGKKKLEKGVQEIYLINAKQKISRLIQMKRQRQSDFWKVNSKIKIARTQRHTKRIKPNLQSINMVSIEQQQWDKQWKDQVRKQQSRYRNRLRQKYLRKTLPYYGVNK